MQSNAQPWPRLIDLDAATERQLMVGGTRWPARSAMSRVADGPFATRLIADLDAGRPIVTRFDPQLGDEQLRALLLATASLLGSLVPQDVSGDQLVDVLDTRPADTETARGYLSNSRMLLHTDPVEILGLLCLSPATEGGITLLRQAQDVHEQLNQDSGRISIYFQDWSWALPAGSSDTRPGREGVKSPVLARTGEEVVVQYGSHLLRQGIHDDEQAQERWNALDAFDRLANDRGRYTTLTLQRGECLWIDNYRTLHGRTAFEDGGRPRHMVRAWLWRYDPSRRPSAFRSLARAFGSDEQMLQSHGEAAKVKGSV